MLLDPVVEVIGTPLCAATRDGLGVGELGARPIDGDLVVARIQLDEDRAGLDRLVVDDRHAEDRSADARRHRRHVGVHLRIVGGFLARGEPEPADDGDDRHGDRDGRDAEAALLNEGDGVGLSGHQREPPRYRRTDSSATPSARASAAFDTL